jgi:hypothetical protein
MIKKTILIAMASLLSFSANAYTVTKCDEIKTETLARGTNHLNGLRFELVEPERVWITSIEFEELYNSYARFSDKKSKRMLDVKELKDGTVIFYTDKPRYGALRAGMEVIMKPQGDDLYKLTMAYASRGEGKLPNQTTIFEDYLEIGKKRPDGTTDKYVILKLDPKSKEKRDNFKCTK